MNDKVWWAPLTGVLFIALVIVGFAVGGEPPDLDDGVEETVEFYADNRDSIFAGSAIEGIGAAVFIFFGGIFRSRLREAEGSRGTLSAIAFAGTIVFAAGLALDATFNIAINEAVEEQVDSNAVHGLAALWQNDWVPFAVGLLTFLVATGLSIIRYGLLPKWLGWVAILFAVLLVTPANPVGFIGTGVLVLVISVMLAMRERAATPGAPPPPAPPPAATTP
jgi:hypothetical protein